MDHALAQRSRQCKAAGAVCRDAASPHPEVAGSAGARRISRQCRPPGHRIDSGRAAGLEALGGAAGKERLEVGHPPSFPWRVELSQAVEKLIADLASDPDMQAMGERMKAQLLANPLLEEQARSLWDEIERGLEADPQAR